MDTLLALGFGALSMTREKAKRIVDELVKRGEEERVEMHKLLHITAPMGALKNALLLRSEA